MGFSHGCIHSQIQFANLSTPANLQQQHLGFTKEWATLMNNKHKQLFWCHMYAHWSDLNVPFDSISRKSFSSLLAPEPGLKTSASPHSVHVSLSFPPIHQPPGAGFPGMRPRIFSSMRSRTGSSLRNGEANAAPVLVRRKKSVELRCRVSCRTL